VIYFCDECAKSIYEVGVEIGEHTDPAVRADVVAALWRLRATWEIDPARGDDDIALPAALSALLALPAALSALPAALPRRLTAALGIGAGFDVRNFLTSLQLAPDRAGGLVVDLHRRGDLPVRGLRPRPKQLGD